MKGKLLFITLGLFLLSMYTYGQDGFKSESELKEKATELFNADKLIEATPLYAQLLSLYPQDAEYNFKYGACLLASDADTEKPIKYLSFALTKGADPLAHFYLGRAYHLNYQFAKAVKQYSRFKTKSSSDLRKKYQVERQIEMCKNGNQLLSRINEVQVIEKKEIAAKDFYRVYDLEGINGKLIVSPEDFQSKYDKKIGEKSIIFLPNNATELYYSSYGKKGETGRDIYKVVKLSSDSWSEPVKLGEGINTPYDEEYPYILPDGRTMYFASKGHNSMGGYDLFKSTYDQSTGKWKAPENLDFAFSSADDDIMFVTDASGQLAYFASNRSNEAGKFTVYKVLVEKKAAEVSVIKGKFIAENNPDLKKAKVTVVDKATNETVGVYETDKNGNYSVEIASNGGSYQFSLETTDADPIHTGVVNIPKQDEFSILGQELRLVGEGNDQQLVIKNIFDGTMAANTSSSGPQISSELLKMKANLDVNFAASNLDQLSFNAEAKEVQETPLSKPSVSNIDKSETTDGTISSNSSNNSSDQSKTVKDDQVKALTEELSSSESTVDESVQLKERITNSNYSNAIELQLEAEKLFKEKDQLVQNGADKESIEKKEEEAQIKALEAGFATQIALKTDASSNNDKSVLEQIESLKTQLNSTFDGNFDMISQKVEDIETSTRSIEKTEDIFQYELDEVSKQIIENQKEINSNKAKRESLDSEQKRIEGQISELVLKLENANEEEGKTISQQIDQLSIDLEDIAYQQYNSSQDYEQSVAQGNALKLKEKLLKERQVELDNLKVNPSLAVEPVNETNKKALVDQMKLFRDNNQMAYSDLVNLDGKSSDKTISTVQLDNLTVSSELVQNINATYEEELSKVQANADVDLKAAQELRVYDNWINELESKLIEREAALGQASDEEASKNVRTDIEELQTQIDLIGKRRNDLEDLIAQDNLVENNSDESSVSNQSSTDNATTSIDNTVVTETDLSSTDNVIESTSNYVQTPDIDISEVDGSTIINEDFTNLDFEQEIEYDNPESAQEMLLAKKTLFEASKIAEQAEEARQAAYSLPTVEERTAAFEKANGLEKLSEEKQIEAANYYARFNKNEYLINQERINNANEYGDDFESSNLDIANLLSEEAQAYFNSAEVIRESLDPNARHSVKEVELQKAYDYELLALNKQQEALKKLNLANKDYNDPKPTFVQTITDAEVLSVSDANVAKALGDSLSATVTDLKSNAQQKIDEAQALPIGSERDSLLAVAETLSSEAEKNEKKATLYYQREEQINDGVDSDEPSDPTANVIRPRKIKEFESTTVELDTVEISDERKQLVLNSQAFSQYASNQRNRDRLSKEAELEYNKAIQLSEQLQQLKKQAYVENTKAQNEPEGEEKQRLVKSAQVLDQKALAVTNSIDSINKIIKIKNYLISSSEQKMDASIANLSEVEQKEIKKLSQTYEGDLALSEDLAINNTIDNSESATDERRGGETSESGLDQNTQNLDENSIGEIPLVDAGSSNNTDPTSPNQGTPSTSSRNNEGGSDSNVTSTDNNASNINGNGSETKRSEDLPIVNSVVGDINKIPREVKQAIFVTLEKEESVYNVSNPIPVDIDMPEGLVYKVQVGAFRNPIPQNLFKGFAPLSAEKTESGITRYTAGFFVTEQTAVNARNGIRKLGYPDAFVVAFLNGKRISLTQARVNSGEATPIEEGTASYVQDTDLTQTAEGTSQGLTNRFTNSVSVELEEVVNVATIQGVYYTVQIGVYSKPVKKGTFSKYSNLNVCELPTGLIRYNTGIFNSSIEAADLKITVQTDIADAFVTAYSNGKRISLNEAARLKNKE